MSSEGSDEHPVSARGETADRAVVSSQLQLLRHPVFGPFVVGKLLATTGLWVHNIAAAIVMYQVTRSAAWVGLVSVAQFAPQFLLTPLSGARADHGDRRRQLLLGRGVTGMASCGLAIYLGVAGTQRPSVAGAIIASAFMVGVGYCIGAPAMQSLIPSMVPRKDLANAVALNTMPNTLARAIGPAIGALLLTTSHPAWAFAVAGVASLVYAAIIVLVDLGARPRRRAVDSSVRAGLRYVRRDPPLILLLVGTATVGMGTDPIITLTPALAELLGGGEPLVGAMASFFGLGAGLGFLVLARLRARLGSARVCTTGLVFIAAGFGSLAATPTSEVALMILLIAGLGMTFSLTCVATMVQQRVTEDVRGRVMALWTVAFMGAKPIAAATNGLVADLASVQAALLVAAAIGLVGAWLSRPSQVQGPRPEMNSE